MKLAVYVPKDGVTVPGLEGKDPRAVALVAVPNSKTLRLAVCQRVTQHGHRDFCFADRVREAASALLGHGRSHSVRVIEVVALDFKDVALWDDSEGVVRILPGRQQQFHRWLGSVAYRNDLEASDSAHNVHQEASQNMRRAHIQGRPDKAAQITRKHGLRGW